MASARVWMPFGPMPLKKPEAYTDGDSDGKVCTYGPRKFNSEEEEEEEYRRQYELFYYQFERSEGFVIDWEKFDFPFGSRPVALAPPLARGLTNEQLIHQLTIRAINQHNEEKGTSLEFVEHVEANFRPCRGYVFWITFRARDLSSSNSEAKRYQTKVLKFRDEIEVHLFRPRPTDEEIASVHVAPPRPFRCQAGEARRILLDRILDTKAPRI